MVIDLENNEASLFLHPKSSILFIDTKGIDTFSFWFSHFKV